MVENYNRLNIGCGRFPLMGWINLDSFMLEGVDVFANLDDCANIPLPMMQELHRIAKPHAKVIFRCP